MVAMGAPAASAVGRSACVEGAMEVGDWWPGVVAAGSDAGAAVGKGSGGDEVVWCCWVGLGGIGAG